MGRTTTIIIAAAAAVVILAGGLLLMLGRGTEKDVNQLDAELTSMKLPGEKGAPEGIKPKPASGDALVVVSWGGAYTKSQVEAYHKPF